MSGAEAFALVTGVMTVITFAGQTASVCKALYDGQSVDDDLETMASRLKDAADMVHTSRSRLRPLEKNEQQLVDIAHQCQQVAADLLVEIYSLKTLKRGNIVKIFGMAAISSLNQSKLRRLEGSLESCRSMLHTGLLSRLE